MKITSLKLKLLLILVPAFFISFATLAGISAYLANEHLSKSILNETTAMNSDYANRIDSHIDKAILQLKSFSAIKRIKNPTDKAQLVAALKECTEQLDVLENVTYIHLDGNAVRPDGSVF